MSEQPELLGEQHSRAEADHWDGRPAGPQGDLRGLLRDCVAEAVRPQCSKWSSPPSPLELLGIATMDLPTRPTLWILPSS